VKKRARPTRNKVDAIIWAIARLDERQKSRLIGRIADAAAHFFNKCYCVAPLIARKPEFMAELFATSSPHEQFATILEQELLSRNNTLSGFLYHDTKTASNDPSLLNERISSLYTHVQDAIISRQGNSGRDEKKHSQTLKGLAMLRAGKKYREIAAKLGTSESAIKQRVSRHLRNVAQQARRDK